MQILQYEIAKKIYEELKEKAAGCADEDLKELYQDFLDSAAKYAKTRLAWSFMDMASRREDDRSRSIKHSGFIASLTSTCRNFGLDAIEELMPDRKTKGDFACYVALFLALEQR